MRGYDGVYCYDLRASAGRHAPGVKPTKLGMPTRAQLMGS
jgi:hypothetical protein